MIVDTATAAALDFCRSAFQALGRNRRERRRELEERFEEYVAATTQIEVTYAHEFRADRPATTPIGRGLTRLGTFLTAALFSSRETEGFSELLRPDLAQRNADLRTRLVEASIRLGRIAPEALVDAQERLFNVLVEWERSQAPASPEFEAALRNLTATYAEVTRRRFIPRLRNPHSAPGVGTPA